MYFMIIWLALILAWAIQERKKLGMGITSASAFFNTVPYRAGNMTSSLAGVKNQIEYLLNGHSMTLCSYLLQVLDFIELKIKTDRLIAQIFSDIVQSYLALILSYFWMFFEAWHSILLQLVDVLFKIVA